MSHTSSIASVPITDINVLRAAIEELARNGMSIRLETGGTPRAYFNNQAGMGKAAYVVRIPQADFDIGLYPIEGGKGYEARTDFFGGSVERCLGGTPTNAKDSQNLIQAKLGKLYQMYGVHQATKAAQAKGYMVRRVAGPNDQIKLVVTGAHL